MNRTIVIVDDDDHSLYLSRFLLEKRGYRVVEARNGREGIDAARRENPALVVLDIQLPQMNGYEVAGQLNRDPETADIPIVVVTSFAMPGDKEGILASGCDGYIEKPIDPDTFVSEVEKFLPNDIPPMDRR